MSTNRIDLLRISASKVGSEWLLTRVPGGLTDFPHTQQLSLCIEEFNECAGAIVEKERDLAVAAVGRCEGVQMSIVVEISNAG